jgi:DNA-binding transcriptional regulator YdaS (Cro superfamily)
MRYCEALCAWLISEKITSVRLAELLGIHESSVAKWRRGLQIPALQWSMKITELSKGVVPFALAELERRERAAVSNALRSASMKARNDDAPIAAPAPVVYRHEQATPKQSRHNYPRGENVPLPHVNFGAFEDDDGIPKSKGLINGIVQPEYNCGSGAAMCAALGSGRDGDKSPRQKEYDRKYHLARRQREREARL